MGESADRKFDWVAALAVACGGTVTLIGLAALVMTLATVTAMFF